MVTVKQQFVSSNLAKKVTYNGINTKEYIIIHETANTSKGANAQAHANLQSNGNSRQASWQYQVDDKQVIQSFSDDAQCWAASNPYYNKNGINIEICVNSDGNYKQAANNAVELTKHLMGKYKIPLKNVVTHNHTSPQNKPCPRNLLSGAQGITWTQFKDKLTNTSTTSIKPTTDAQSKPQTPSNTSNQTVKPNYNTKSIVEFLSSINQPYSLAHRKKLASYYGVGGGKYNGQASLNLQLLSLIQKDYKANGKLRTSKPVAKLKIDGYMGPLTIKELQRYFGTPVDGVLSNPSLVIKAMQKWLGTTQDGYISEPYSSMVAALQRKFGMKIVDGKLSKPSLVIKELQRRLNNGKL